MNSFLFLSVCLSVCLSIILSSLCSCVVWKIWDMCPCLVWKLDLTSRSQLQLLAPVDIFFRQSFQLMDKDRERRIGVDWFVRMQELQIITESTFDLELNQLQSFRQWNSIHRRQQRIFVVGWWTIVRQHYGCALASLGWLWGCHVCRVGAI